MKRKISNFSNLTLSSYTGELVKVNIDTPSKCVSIINGIGGVTGMVTVKNCIANNKPYLYLFNNKAYRVDWDNKTAHLLKSGLLVSGATSSEEFMRSSARALDTIQVFPANCGKSNGSIAIKMIPGVEVRDLRFSLDGETWQQDGVFSGLNAQTYKVHIHCDCGDAVFPIVLNSKESDCPQMPNVFTPDGDGVNDTFGRIIPPDSEPPGYHLEIYNRWGERIFQSSENLQRWDGRLQNGQDAPQDVYIYHITALNGTELLRGSVTLLR